MGVTNKMLVCEKVKTLNTVIGELPELPVGGFIVKVEYCGICHSDAHMYSEESYFFFLPRILGHEIAGTVYQIDKDCKDKSIAVGDRVVVFCFGGCRKCEQCHAGYSTCGNQHGHHSHAYGLWRDGGYQQYIGVEDSWSLVKVPDDIPLDKACVVPCSGVTAYNALRQSEDVIKKAQKIYGKAKVAVIGVGGLGLWAIEFTKVFYGDSVTVCAVDLFQNKLDHAKTVGADVTVLLSKEDNENKTISKITDSVDGKVDVVMDFVGTASTVTTALKTLNPGGTLAMVGLGGNTLPAVKLQLLIANNLRIQAVYVGHKFYVPEIFQLLSSKKIKGPPTKTVAFEEIGSVMDKLVKREPYNGRFVAKM